MSSSSSGLLAPVDRPRFFFVLTVFVLLALYPLLAGKFGVDLVTKIMIYAILALSLELLVGTTGLVCFGHAALFGIGAYTALKLSPEFEPAAIWWLLPACVLASALYALFMGSLSLRTKGVYFIMVTLAFAQMAYYLAHDTPLGGGTDGIYLNVKPSVAIGGTELLSLDDAKAMYGLTLACLVRCCCAPVSGVHWPASSRTSSAWLPQASRPIRTSWLPLSFPVRWPDLPASSSPSRTATSAPRCSAGTSPARC
jgi:hypothetical protein